MTIEGSIIFPCAGQIINFKFSVSCWSATMEGSQSSSMSRINLKFKIFSKLLVSNNVGIIHLSTSRPNHKFKIFSELPVGDNFGVNHLSMSRLNLKFKIFSELLVGAMKGGQSPFNAQAKM